MSRAQYRFKLKPYTHQKEAIKFCLSQFQKGRNPALLMEQRTGKTKVTVDTIGCLHAMKGLRKILVIAPNRVLGTWVKEINAHCPYLAQTVVWDSEARKHPIPSAAAYDLQVLIVNFEAFSTPGKKLPSGARSKASGRFKVRTMLEKWAGDDDVMCVVDESHKIKSASGKSSIMIVNMAKMFKYRMILTGTPVTKANRIHDIYMQWRFLNPGSFPWKTSEEFKQNTGRWITSNGYEQYVGERPAGVATVQRVIHADSYVVKREDCFDLPPREERVLEVELSATTLRHYDEMAELMVTQIKEGVIAEASIPLVVTLRLLQITSGFLKVEDDVHAIGAEKLEALKELLTEDIIEQDQQVVIAARFKHDLDRIARLCERLRLPVWQIRGGLKRDDTDRALREFQRAKGRPGAMLIQPAAASLGIDLSTASRFVWYSLTHSWTDYVQATDRVALSRNSTTIDHLLATGTVDRLVYDVLRTDGEVAKAIMKNPERLLHRG